MKNSAYLRAAVQSVLDSHPALNMTDRVVFLRNLVFMYAVMVASENLLRTAASHSDGYLRAYFEHHLEEESGHERWLADDLADAGIDLSALPISPEAVAMAGAQYYLIHHVDAAALLGYMAVLECFPADLGVVEKMESLHGERLCRTLRYHATHDVEHGADLMQVIDQLPESRFRLVVENAIQTAFYIGAAASKFIH